MTEFSFKAEDKTFEEVLFSNSSPRFRIPRYQRPYAWSKEQAEDYWNDLIDTQNSSHFIGSFVLNRENVSNQGYIDVIDGQQRILTTCIFLSVIRDVARQFGGKLSEQIQRNSLAHVDRKDNQTSRILCGESTREFFESHIFNGDGESILNETPSLAEHKQIKDNYLLLKGKVDSHIKDVTGNDPKLTRLEILWDKVYSIKVIQIVIESEEDAYEIFETVNARGVDLSVADLLKNLIFKRIVTKDLEGKDIAKEKWNIIEQNVHAANSEMTKFFRYYWLSKYSFVSEKQLFKTIKNTITKDEYEAFLDDLVKASKWFNLIFTGTEEEWTSEFGKKGFRIHKSLKGIRSMGAIQSNVFFLSVFRNFEKLNTDPRKIFETIEKFILNYFAVCKLPANKVERIYSKYAIELEVAANGLNPKRVSANVQRVFASLTTDLQDLRPYKDEFLVKFRSISYGGEKPRRLIKYILGTFNYEHSSKENILDSWNVNIEHILPQNPNKNWKVSKSDIKDYVNLLGNLTLISVATNSSIGNKTIKEKVEHLESSELPVTNEIVAFIKNENYIWTESQIHHRQEQLAKEAYDSIWNY